MIESPVPPDDTTPKSVIELLRTSYGGLFAANLVSSTSLWFLDIVAVILVFRETNSALWVSLVAVVGFGASIVMSPLGGFIADRWNRQLSLGIAFGAVGLAALMMIVTPGATTQVGLILMITIAGGTARGLYSPIGQSLTADLVRRSDLAAASSLTSMGFSVGRVIGPALGATAVTTLGGRASYAIIAVFMFSCVVMLFANSGISRVSSPATQASRMSSPATERRTPQIALLILVSAIIGATTDPVLTLGPSLAESWGQEAWVAGLAVSAFGAGAVCAGFAGAALRRRIGRYRLTTVSLLIVAACFASVAVIPWPPVSLALLALAGAAFLTANSDTMTLLQEQINPASRGRIWAIWSIAFLGSRPIAAVVGGAITDAISVSAAMAAMAVIALSGAALIDSTRRRWASEL